MIILLIIFCVALFVEGVLIVLLFQAYRHQILRVDLIMQIMEEYNE